MPLPSPETGVIVIAVRATAVTGVDVEGSVQEVVKGVEVMASTIVGILNPSVPHVVLPAEEERKTHLVPRRRNTGHAAITAVKNLSAEDVAALREGTMSEWKGEEVVRWWGKHGHNRPTRRAAARRRFTRGHVPRVGPRFPCV